MSNVPYAAALVGLQYFKNISLNLSYLFLYPSRRNVLPESQVKESNNSKQFFSQVNIHNWLTQYLFGNVKIFSRWSKHYGVIFPTALNFLFEVLHLWRCRKRERFAHVLALLKQYHSGIFHTYRLMLLIQVILICLKPLTKDRGGGWSLLCAPTAPRWPVRPKARQRRSPGAVPGSGLRLVRSLPCVSHH